MLRYKARGQKEIESKQIAIQDDESFKNDGYVIQMDVRQFWIGRTTSSASSDL